MRNRVRSRLILLLAIAVMSMAGCTFTVRPSPVPILGEQKINLSVGLLVDDKAASQTSSTSGLCLVGMGHTWKVDTGSALLQGSEVTFSKMFKEVKWLKGKEDFDSSDLVLLVAPRIEQFAVSQDLTATLSLGCLLADRTGKVLYEKAYPVTGKSQTATGCLLGVMGGETAIRETSEDAFKKAFQLLAEDILKTVDFSPYLK